MTTAHTATPYTHIPARRDRQLDGSNHVIGPFVHADGVGIIANTGFNPNMEANAAFIVRACNAHDDLVKALEACFDYPADVFDLGADETFTMTVLGSHLHMVRAALAKAKGQL